MKIFFFPPPVITVKVLIKERSLHLHHMYNSIHLKTLSP